MNLCFEVFGIDLVKLQFHLAEGGRVPNEILQARGCAIECRVNANDSGSILDLQLPCGKDIRVDSGIQKGSFVSPRYQFKKNLLFID